LLVDRLFEQGSQTCCQLKALRTWFKAGGRGLGLAGGNGGEVCVELAACVGAARQFRSVEL